MPHEGFSYAKPKREISPARRAALSLGTKIRERDAFAHDVLEAHLDDERLSASDRAFASLLVLGVVACRGTLDELIDMVVDKPKSLQPQVRDALRISAYELYFLDKDTHAAVDQGVELVRSIAPKAAGLANAVLRRLAKMRVDFPFGNPHEDISACARLHAFPVWLTKRLIDELGFQNAWKLMEASNEPAPLFIAVNAIKGDDARIVEALRTAGAQVKPVSSIVCDLQGCYYVDSGRVLRDKKVKRLLSEGAFLVADASSQTVARIALGDVGTKSMLEIGAGRATKTILIQSDAYRAFGRQVDLTSLDNMAFKVRLAKKRASEYGVEISDAIVGDGTKLDAVLGDKQFNTVFIDAPCTGLGTLRRHPEIRWRIKPASVENMAALGYRLIENASEHVAPGGKLVYATCTVTREENTGVIARFLKSPAGADFKLELIGGKPCFAGLLSKGSPDAHFAAVLRRI
ncbi:MAG: antitermination protein NusB [Eggerthellaceae bacterium]|nr:antitermination protein NusB [Eggerthellaceae bacterium]